MGIIRDAAQSGKTGFFIHFTYGHFKAIVDRGDGSWEDVRTLKNIGSTLHSKRYGFSPVDLSKFYDFDDTMTLEESVRAAGIERFEVSRNDVRLANSNGTSPSQHIYPLYPPVADYS